jgi:hypothetical protein
VDEFEINVHWEESSRRNQFLLEYTGIEYEEN